MKNFLNSKLFLHLFVLLLVWKMKPRCTFLTLAFKQNLLPQNTLQSPFFSFPDKDNFKIICILYSNYLLNIMLFVIYLFKCREARKISLEGLKKNIIKIYNIEEQLCFKDSKKETKFKKKWQKTHTDKQNLLQKVPGQWW